MNWLKLNNRLIVITFGIITMCIVLWISELSNNVCYKFEAECNQPYILELLELIIFKLNYVVAVGCVFNLCNQYEGRKTVRKLFERLSISIVLISCLLLPILKFAH